MIHRLGLAGALLASISGPPAQAEPPANPCHAVADKIREKFMNAQTNELGPLEALTALGDGSIRLTQEDPAGWASGAAQAAWLSQEHSVPDGLLDSVRALGDNVSRIELSGVPIWVFDRSGGTLGCHMLVAAWVPAGATGQEIDLPFGRSEADLCGASIMAADIGGRAALIAETDSWDPDHADAKLTITPIEGTQVDAPCDVDVRYAIAFRAEHAFCREGVDCAAIMHAAEEFADRRRGGGDPSALAGHVDQDRANKLRAGYDRMQEIDGQTENLNVVPTFDKFMSATGADQFGQDAELFPFRAWSGDYYLARLGHGHRNFEESIGYIFAAYSLNGDQTTPVAGVSIEAHRAAITSVEVK